MSECLERHSIGYIGRFSAMASTCEVIMETQNARIAQEVLAMALHEVLRIERKFSRYQPDSILSQIHRNRNQPVTVDTETAMMLDFSAQAWQLSKGLFDITSGILRKIWKFDGGNRIPSRKQAKALLPYIGWNKVQWENPCITLPNHMELDFGGFGKEYAADRAITLIQAKYDLPVMVNLGGDLRVSSNLCHKPCWEVMIESIYTHKQHKKFRLQQGAVVTSGDTRKFLQKNGVRYGHILHPCTGWSVMQAPASVTVGGKTCLEAGLIATLAMLKGRKAEYFLAAQDVVHWVQRYQS